MPPRVLHGLRDRNQQMPSTTRTFCLRLPFWLRLRGPDVDGIPNRKLQVATQDASIGESRIGTHLDRGIEMVTGREKNDPGAVGGGDQPLEP